MMFQIMIVEYFKKTKLLPEEEEVTGTVLGIAVADHFS